MSCCLLEGLPAMQVPGDQKETLADALAMARKEVEEYRENGAILK